MPLATILLDALPWLIGVWLFALGGAIGSFLNVVVYRVPAGISLVHPGSHCPNCKAPIRWSDNVPIFGWLMLRGRCRDCRGAISPRYPAVEAVTAVTFVVVGLAECVPFGIIPPPTAEQTAAELWGIYAYHLLLLCTLLGAVGIEFDGHRVPPRLFVPAMIVGLAAPVFWPHLHGVHTCGAIPGWLATGVPAGLLFGWGASRGCRPGGTALICGLGVVGAFLGWQAIVVLALVVGAVYLLPWARRRKTPILWLTVATFVWILIGPQITI